MDAGTVSFQTTREYYGVWRWKIERQSSNRLVKLWAEIGSSSLDDAAKVSLVNVAWALASSSHMTFWSRTLFEPKRRTT
jgi:hypothetical protein